MAIIALMFSDDKYAYSCTFNLDQYVFFSGMFYADKTILDQCLGIQLTLA